MADVLPTGTVTFLFTDVEGSTRLLHETGAQYDALLDAHRRLIRDAARAHGGIEFGTGGDAVYLAFATASGAVTAAASAQRAIELHPWPEGCRIRVRMGLHTGEARLVDGDYRGMALHVTARLCSAGHGGQVLVSGSTAALVTHPLLDLGTHRLRDVPDDVTIHQLAVDGVDGSHPALRTMSSRPNNLPAPTDTFLGREVETDAVVAALAEHRLVTLLGPGGVGKTRLALAVGERALGGFRDGVWLVPLGGVSSDDEVATITAQVLRISERPGQGLEETVAERVVDREALLILDNCEHVVDGTASLVTAVLERAPGLRVLATSRELLAVRGEKAVAVLPLAEGGAHRPGPATELFVARASEVAPDLELGPDEIEVVRAICRRLDGLPLAIELAAARLRAISLGDLAARLDDRFRLLTGGSRGAPGRQRTLEAVVAWSYDLLSDEERQVFRALSVLPDDFPLEAVEAVTGSDPLDVVDVVGHLVDKSLLVVSSVERTSRYRMLETIRQYGRDRLAEAGEAEGSRDRMTGWMLSVAECLEEDMRTRRQDAALRAVLPERATARAAADWAAERGSPAAALRIVAAVPCLPTAQRLRRLEELSEHAELDEVPAPVRAHVLLTRANLAMEVGWWDQSIVASREAGEVFARLGDARMAAWANYFRGFGLLALDAERPVVRRIAEGAREAFEEADDEFGLAYALWLGAMVEDDPGAALDELGRAEDLFRQMAAPFGLAHVLESRALAELRAGLVPSPERLDEALATFSDADNPGCTAHALEATAAVLVGRGEVAVAARLVGAAERLRSDVGQDHRPWEREGLARTLDAFTDVPTEVIDASRAAGTLLSMSGSVAAARSALLVDVGDG